MISILGENEAENDEEHMSDDILSIMFITSALLIGLPILYMLVAVCTKKLRGISVSASQVKLITANVDFYYLLFRCRAMQLGVLTSLIKAYDEGRVLPTEYLEQLWERAGMDRSQINHAESSIYESFKPVLKRQYEFMSSPLVGVETPGLILQQGEIAYLQLPVTYIKDSLIDGGMTYARFNRKVGNFDYGSVHYRQRRYKAFVKQAVGILYITNQRLLFISKDNRMNCSFVYNTVLSYKKDKHQYRFDLDGKDSIIFEFKEYDVDGFNGQLFFKDSPYNLLFPLLHKLLNNNDYLYPISKH